MCRLRIFSGPGALKRTYMTIARKDPDVKQQKVMNAVGGLFHLLSATATSHFVLERRRLIKTPLLPIASS
jgi:hypothetical protein